MSSGSFSTLFLIPGESLNIRIDHEGLPGIYEEVTSSRSNHDLKGCTSPWVTRGMPSPEDGRLSQGWPIYGPVDEICIHTREKFHLCSQA